jgi:DnaJ-domain-containing protein 1
MTDPYQVLGLETTAGREEIRQRYLELVRQYTPERSPERFAQIRDAYERLRDPLVALEHQLFLTRATMTLPGLAADVEPGQRRRLPTQLLLTLARR